MSVTLLAAGQLDAPSHLADYMTTYTHCDGVHALTVQAVLHLLCMPSVLAVICTVVSHPFPDTAFKAATILDSSVLGAFTMHNQHCSTGAPAVTSSLWVVSSDVCCVQVPNVILVMITKWTSLHSDGQLWLSRAGSKLLLVRWPAVSRP